MKNGVENEYGEIAQLARARGSYPRCRGFESPSRYGWRLLCEQESFFVFLADDFFFWLGIV